MNKIIIVTGAGGGLGLCIVKRHLEERDIVFGLDFSVTDELKTLEKTDQNFHSYFCDISSDESVKKVAKIIGNQEKQIDILYNVAGIFSEFGRVGIGDTDLELCQRMMNINAFGVLRVCKEFRNYLVSESVIINVSSEAGSIGGARRTQEYGYCMSKAAMNMCAKILSNELWSIGARVMCVHPGWMRTSMGGKAAQDSIHSVHPEESAQNIVSLALGIDAIPREQMYMNHTGEILPW